MISKVLKIMVNIIALIISIIVSSQWQGSFSSFGEIIGGALIFFFIIAGSFHLLIDFIKETKIKKYPKKLIKGLFSLLGFLLGSVLLISLEAFISLFHLHALIIFFILLVIWSVINELKYKS